MKLSTEALKEETLVQKSTDTGDSFPLLLPFSQNQILRWYVSTSNPQKKILVHAALDFHSFPSSFTLLLHLSCHKTNI